MLGVNSFACSHIEILPHSGPLCYHALKTTRRGENMTSTLREGLTLLMSIPSYEKARASYHYIISTRAGLEGGQQATHYQQLYSGLRQGLNRSQNIEALLSADTRRALTRVCEGLLNDELDTLQHAALLYQQALAPIGDVTGARASTRNHTPHQASDTGYFVTSPRDYHKIIDGQTITRRYYNLHYRFYATDGRQGKTVNVYVSSLHGWPNAFMRAIMRGMMSPAQRLAVYYGVAIDVNEAIDTPLTASTLWPAIEQATTERAISEHDENSPLNPADLPPAVLHERIEHDVLAAGDSVITRGDIVGAWNGAIEGRRGYDGIKALKARVPADTAEQARGLAAVWGRVYV